MSTIEESLKHAMQIQGAIGASLVDCTTGFALGQASGQGVDIVVASAGTTDIVRATFDTMASLGLEDTLENILITLSGQFHLVRLVEGHPTERLFFCLLLDKERANVAMARRELRSIEKDLVP